MHGPPWRCLFSNLDFHKFHKHDIVVDSSGYGSTKLPEKSSHILTLWFITKKHIYIYICMFLIKDIISIHSFVLTTTNSPPSTHLPTENNLPNLPTDCSKLLIFTDRLLSKTGSTFYDFSLKPSTHWESREPLNWVTENIWGCFGVNHLAPMLSRKERSKRGRSYVSRFLWFPNGDDVGDAAFTVESSRIQLDVYLTALVLEVKHS